jgi:uncharacterized membrane protein YgdD (TMEM256/DUF423 family)
MRPNWIAVGAGLGALAVITGAFGAHLLKQRLAPEDLELWKTAVLYHLLHAPVLMLYGHFDREEQGRVAGWCFLIGTIVFSGSLYAMALGAPSWFGAITPIGGVLLIVGWLAFAMHAQRALRDTRGP